MYKNRINRTIQSLPPTQGRKNWETGETHAPLNERASRVGGVKIKRRRKCHCKLCGGNKHNKISEQEKHWTKWNND